MNNKAYLALYFDAPLQSWGYESKFDRRTTLAHPTRSGVIGLLCAALGVDRANTDGLKRLEDGLGVTVYVFGIEGQVQGRLTDYHTVGGGYDSKRNPQNICKRAAGGVGDTVQTWREYLEDARFGVVVSGDSKLVSELAAAVQDPIWGIWLGRKACIPAARVFEGVHAEESEALAALIGVVGEAMQVKRKISEADCFENGNDMLMDRPLDFSERKFAPRRILVD